MLSDNAPLALSVRNYASGDAKFLHPEVPLTSSVVDQLEKVGYSARDLEIEGSHEGLLAEVYSHGLYKLDAALVLKLVRSQHSGQGDLRGPQLSNALAVHSEWPAYGKVDAHPAEYLQTSIGGFGELEDTESTVAWLVTSRRFWMPTARGLLCLGLEGRSHPGCRRYRGRGSLGGPCACR